MAAIEIIDGEITENSFRHFINPQGKKSPPEAYKVHQSSNALWSPSYFIGSVGGAPIEVLRQYIEK
ncbi:MAG: putative transposase [Paraglaciecola sp.]